MDISPNYKPPFDFQYLYNYTHNPSTPTRYILRPYLNQSIITLSYEGCVAAVGVGINYYSRQDVYERVLLWRLPLIALWATTTIPALGFHTWLFTLAHVISDPIDSTWSLLFKLDLAQRTARWAKNNDNTLSSFTFASETAYIRSPALAESTKSSDEDLVKSAMQRTNLINRVLYEEQSPLPEYFHDIIALIVTAYGEWEYGQQAMDAMNYAFHSKLWSPVQRTTFRKVCANAAFFIAADRVARFLPTVIAGLVFFVQLFAAFWKTLAQLGDHFDALNPVSAGVNRAPHNVAFGALFFWLPFVVLMTAIVGGSQTSHMVPRILNNFRQEFISIYQSARNPLIERTPIYGRIRRKPVADTLQPSSTSDIVSFPDIFPEQDHRWSHGGLPVWQVMKFRDLKKSTHQTTTHKRFVLTAVLSSFAIVAIPTACAISLSWLTPTEGFGCRGMTQLSFLIMWVISALIDWLLFTIAESQRTGAPQYNTIPAQNRPDYATIYWITLSKDLTFTAGTIILLTWSSLGIFNRCSCWCKWPSFNTSYLTFLQDPQIFELIRHRLSWTFPLIVGFALLFETFMFIAVRVLFNVGCRVLEQRDIDEVLKSRNSWWNRLRRRIRGLKPSKRIVKGRDDVVIETDGDTGDNNGSSRAGGTKTAWTGTEEVPLMRVARETTAS